MDETDGRFLVTHADEGTAVLKEVTRGGVYTLAENPDLEENEVVVGTVAPEPPMEVSWRLEVVEDRYHLEVERSPEPPTKQEREIAADQPTGELVRRERAGDGELHVIPVPDERTERVVEDVLEDEATFARAARLGVGRVEVRSETGLVCVRYLP